MVRNFWLYFAALLAIAFLTLLFMRVRSHQQLSKVWQSLASAPAEKVFTADMVAELPYPAKRYFLHAIAPGTPLANSVQLEMTGGFKLKPDQPWLSMQATEIISTLKGFVWKAVIRGGLIQFQGADYYINGMGKVQFALWGVIPIVNGHNHDIARSSVGRMAGEFIWLPSALLPQQGVIWKEVDEKTVEAQLIIDDELVTLTLVVDSDGKLLEISLPRWGDKTDDGNWKYIPFGVKVQAERTFNGFTIPSEIIGGWWFGTNRYLEFFRATIEQAEFR